MTLRLPLFDRAMGDMDQVYRLHKWAGIAAARPRSRLLVTEK